MGQVLLLYSSVSARTPFPCAPVIPSLSPPAPLVLQAGKWGAGLSVAGGEKRIDGGE